MKDSLQSDVPVGILFSGGVDSSICLSECSRQREANDAFTLVSDEHKCNAMEADRATMTGSALGFRPHAISFGSADIWRLPDLLKHFGEPFGCGAMLYADPFFEKVRQHVVVAIGGNGADEVFGGYEYFAASQRFKKTKRLLRYLCGGMPGMGRAISRISRRLNFVLPLQDALGEDVRSYSRFLSDNIEGPTLSGIGHLTDVAVPILDRVREVEGDEPLDYETYVSLMITTQHTFGSLPDIVGMRHGLEIRSPFLDARLIDFAFGLPAHHRIPRPFDPRYNKGVLKKAYEGVIPSEMLYGRKYGFGYGISFADLLRTQWRRLFEELCLGGESVAAGLIDAEKLLPLWHEHLASSGDSVKGEMMWDVLVLEIWLRAVCMKESLVDRFHNNIAIAR